MSRLLNFRDDRTEVLRLVRSEGHGLPPQVVADARAILSAVEARGDDALIELTERFDGVRLAPSTLRVSAEDLAAGAANASPTLRSAIDTAIANIRAFHAPQRPLPFAMSRRGGATLELRWRPVAAAGLYVPGGRAAYPTSVLMNAIPAQVAGVARIAVFTVPGTVETNPAVAYALQALGIEEVYRVAGAQAIAAAAFGTATIPPVDVITGPGNAWVAAAKREVVGRVGIDSIAGPSEVLVLADDSADVELVALDLIAQAEHDPLARCILATTSERVADGVLARVDALAAASPRRAIVEAAWRDHGAVIRCAHVDELVEVCALMAPEHLQLFLADPIDVDRLVAGAIFVGPSAPTAAGDYIAGPNHVLHTGSTARFSGPLGVAQFLRTTSVVRGTPGWIAELAEPAALIADYERLPGHAAALRARAADYVASTADAAANVIAPVRALGRYTLAATEARVKLNQNEAPWDVPEALKQRVMAAVAERSWNRYPDFYPDDVLRGLGAMHGLGAENVLLGNGSNELIQALFAAVVGPGVSVALPQPTFTLYAMMVAANHGHTVHVPARDDLGYDLDAWRSLARDGAAHLLLCSPNNPTGVEISDAFVAELAETTPRLVIVDEAYQQFGSFDVSHLVARYPNVAVLRTLSKAAGLAGVRLGYLLAHASLAEEVNKVKLPYNVGIFGLEVARAVLDDPAILASSAAPLVAERARVAASLRAMFAGRPGTRVWDGAANFVLVRLPDAREVFAALHRRGLLVRDVGSYPMLAGCLRITIGTPAENDELLDTIATLVRRETT